MGEKKAAAKVAEQEMAGSYQPNGKITGRPTKKNKEKDQEKKEKGAKGKKAKKGDLNQLNAGHLNQTTQAIDDSSSYMNGLSNQFVGGQIGSDGMSPNFVDPNIQMQMMYGGGNIPAGGYVGGGFDPNQMNSQVQGLMGQQ